MAASLSGSVASARNQAPISSASQASWRTMRAAPASSRTRALAAWWSSAAKGNGTSSAGMPTAVSSATVLSKRRSRASITARGAGTTGT